MAVLIVWTEIQILEIVLVGEKAGAAVDAELERHRQRPVVIPKAYSSRRPACWPARRRYSVHRAETRQTRLPQGPARAQRGGNASGRGEGAAGAAGAGAARWAGAPWQEPLQAPQAEARRCACEPRLAPARRTGSRARTPRRGMSIDACQFTTKKKGTDRPPTAHGQSSSKQFDQRLESPAQMCGGLAIFTPRRESGADASQCKQTAQDTILDTPAERMTRSGRARLQHRIPARLRVRPRTNWRRRPPMLSRRARARRRRPQRTQR